MKKIILILMLVGLAAVVLEILEFVGGIILSVVAILCILAAIILWIVNSLRK